MRNLKSWVIIKAVLFTIIVPGTVTVLVPYLLLPGRAEFDVGSWRFAGIGLIALGGAVYLH